MLYETDVDELPYASSKLCNICFKLNMPYIDINSLDNDLSEACGLKKYIHLPWCYYGLLQGGTYS